MTIFTTNEWSRTAPDGAMAALCMAALFVYEGLVWVQTLLLEKDAPFCLVSLTLALKGPWD